MRHGKGTRAISWRRGMTFVTHRPGLEEDRPPSSKPMQFNKKFSP
jgi:hypothetical protein